MKITLVAYGIAKDILEGNHKTLEIPQNATIRDLKNLLVKTYPAFEKLASLQFAIQEEYVDDQTSLHDHQEIIIIPPVSGG